MILIISEKPSSAKKIAEALSNGRERRAGKKVAYYEFHRDGNEMTVAPAVGHIYSLKQKEKDSSYPVFDIEWAPSSEVSKNAAYTKDYLAGIQKLAKGADEVVNACDFDLEGSIIGGNIIRFNAPKKKASRMKFSTLTKNELVEAYENREPLDEKNIDAGEARHVLDWYYGINNSRALMNSMRKAGMFKVMSIGRVQGPTLAVLAKREKEIAAFKPEPFWQLVALIEGIKFLHVKEKFFDEKQADAALANSQKKGVIKSVESRKVKQAPNPPFDLTTLQTEAYRCFGLPPTQTLQLAQELYEAAIISYPRTSSQKLPAKLGLDKIISALAGQAAYKKLAAQLIETKRFTPTEGVKSDSAHPAIYPTGEKPEGLSKQQQQLYDLIVKRFLACFAPEAKLTRMNVVATLGREEYYANGVNTRDPGWHVFYAPYTKHEDVLLPPFEEGQQVEASVIEKLAKQTQPPKRFTQASVIKKMETLGIGTKATRAGIVQTLYDRDYVIEKSIEVTPFGLKVADALEKNVPEILSAELTKSIEDELEQIQEGKTTKEKVIANGRKEIEKISAEFKEREAAVGAELAEALRNTRTQANELGPCKCGKGKLVMRKSKYGLFVGCNEYPRCRQTYPLPKQAGVKGEGKLCEKCGTPIVKILRKGKRPFEMCLDPTCETKKSWTTTASTS